MAMSRSRRGAVPEIFPVRSLPHRRDASSAFRCAKSIAARWLGRFLHDPDPLVRRAAAGRAEGAPLGDFARGEDIRFRHGGACARELSATEDGAAMKVMVRETARGQRPVRPRRISKS